MATAAFQSILPEIVPFRIPHVLGKFAGRILGFDDIERIYGELRRMPDDLPITDRLLHNLSVTWTASDADIARIPLNGPSILVANHPFGILEGAVLASMLGRIRADVRFLANGLLNIIPELREMLIAVDPISGCAAAQRNSSGLRHSLGHLESGGMLVVFPAGEVSHFQWKDRAVTDPEWNTAVARMVRAAARKGCRATVVPAYLGGANGALFQIAGLAHPALRTALLGRELLNKRGYHIEIRTGAPISAEKLLAVPSPREQTDYLRWRTYLLAQREPYKARTSAPIHRIDAALAVAPVAEAADAAEIAAEIAALPTDCLLDHSGGLEVYIAGAAAIPNVLRELGRLREITFRAAGEGTGKARDIDEFDRHYLHLFVWNARKREIAGAYRLARTDLIRRRAGIHGLYTATLFRFDESFLDRLGPALELGRSFVRQEYQKAFAPLLLLWKGIGRYIARHPECKILFGPVSISNQYEAVSRELMVSFLEKYARLEELAGMVRHRNGLRSRVLKGAHRPALPSSGFDVEDLSAVVGDLEQRPAAVPVLLRQYLRLGGKLLGFNVDPKFANALDGLILVDLTRTEPKLLERYLGRREAAEFLAYQKGATRVA